MSDLAKLSLQRLFEDMDDPRVVGRCTYRLVEVVMIAVCGVLCGAETWIEIEEFGKANGCGWKRFCHSGTVLRRMTPFGGCLACYRRKYLRNAFGNG